MLEMMWTHMEEIISSIVSEETIKWAVKTFQPFKLAGTDDIALILLYKVKNAYFLDDTYLVFSLNIFRFKTRVIELSFLNYILIQKSQLYMWPSLTRFSYRNL